MSAPEAFNKESYTIPTFNFGGSTRPNVNTLASTGDPVYIVSGTDNVTITINGTRYGSSKLWQDTIIPTVTSGVASNYTDWTSILGHQLCDKYGQTFSTHLTDVAVYGVSTANTTEQVSYSSSGCKGSKMLAFALQGRTVTIHNVSGNGYITTRPLNSGTTPIAPTSNNSFRYTDAMVTDERVKDYIYINSDTGGGVAQLKVWEG